MRVIQPNEETGVSHEIVSANLGHCSAHLQSSCLRGCGRSMSLHKEALTQKAKAQTNKNGKYLSCAITHMKAVEQHSISKSFLSFLTPVIATARIHIFLIHQFIHLVMKHGSENVFTNYHASLMGTERKIQYLTSASKALVGKAGFLTTGGFA